MLYFCDMLLCNEASLRRSLPIPGIEHLLFFTEPEIFPRINLLLASNSGRTSLVPSQSKWHRNLQCGPEILRLLITLIIRPVLSVVKSLLPKIVIVESRSLCVIMSWHVWKPFVYQDETGWYYCCLSCKEGIFFCMWRYLSKNQLLTSKFNQISSNYPATYPLVHSPTHPSNHVSIHTHSLHPSIHT